MPMLVELQGHSILYDLDKVTPTDDLFDFGQGMHAREVDRLLKHYEVGVLRVHGALAVLN